jgi:hypothetical protein
MPGKLPVLGVTASDALAKVGESGLRLAEAL